MELVFCNLLFKLLVMDNCGFWLIILVNNIELRLGCGEWMLKIDCFMMIFFEIEVLEG